MRESIFFTVTDNSLAFERIYKGDTVVVKKNCPCGPNDLGLFVNDSGLSLRRIGSDHNGLMGKVIRTMIKSG